MNNANKETLTRIDSTYTFMKHPLFHTLIIIILCSLPSLETTKSASLRCCARMAPQLRDKQYNTFAKNNE